MYVYGSCVCVGRGGGYFSGPPFTPCVAPAGGLLVTLPLIPYFIRGIGNYGTVSSYGLSYFLSSTGHRITRCVPLWRNRVESGHTYRLTHIYVQENLL